MALNNKEGTEFALKVFDYIFAKGDDAFTESCREVYGFGDGDRDSTWSTLTNKRYIGFKTYLKPEYAHALMRVLHAYVDNDFWLLSQECLCEDMEVDAVSVEDYIKFSSNNDKIYFREVKDLDSYLGELRIPSLFPILIYPDQLYQWIKDDVPCCFSLEVV